MPASFALHQPRLIQDQLLLAIEAGTGLADRQQLFRWVRGPLQSLLPHEALLCLQVDGHGRVLRTLCLHQALLDSVALTGLTDGLGPALAATWRAGPALPMVADATPLDACGRLLRDNGFSHALVHGSAPGAGAGTVFALLGMPQRPDPGHAWLLQLLLPYLHMGLLRVPGRGAPRPGGETLARALSARELAILEAVRLGRTNEEAARQLGISALTVKNHLQRIYRVLGVANRAHAVARCLALKLL